VSTAIVATPVNLENFARPGGMDSDETGGGRIFCGSAHPSDIYTWCRRLRGHDGDCAAFQFSISVPDVWPRGVLASGQQQTRTRETVSV
jgi:hypothetical protein